MIRYIRNIFILALVVFVSVWIYLNIGDLKRNAIAILQDRLYKATGMHIEASHFSLALPPTLVVHDLILKDDNGSLIFEAKKGSLFIDLSHILKRDFFKKIWLDIENGKLHSIPETVLKGESKPDMKLSEIFLSVNDLDIGPGVFKTIDSLGFIDPDSLKLKNFYFHTSGNFHEVKGEILSDSLNIDNLQLHQLNTHLDIKSTNQHAVGQIKIAALFDQKDLLIDANFEWPFTQQRSLVINASKLKFGDAFISDATAEVNIASLDKWPRFLHIAAKKAIYQDLELSGIDVIATDVEGLALDVYAQAKYRELELTVINLKKDREEETFAFKAEGTWIGQPFTVETDAHYKYGNKELQVTFKSLSGSVDTVAFALNEPGIFNADAAKLTFSPLVLTVDGTVFNGFVGIENNLFSAKGSVTSPKYPQTDVAVQFPLTYSMDPFAFHFDPNTPLSGTLSAEGDVTTILQRLLDSTTSFSGKASASLNLSGTVGSPLLSGTGEITNGSYEIPEIGISLKELIAKVEVQGGYLTITSVEAVDGKGGVVFGAGYYNIDRELNFPFSLQLTLVEATMLNQDYVQIVCNGPLLFAGNSNEGALSGMLQASKASVNIPERSYSTINTVDVTYINIPCNQSKPQSSELQKSRWPLTLDIHLAIQRVLSIKGKDLDSLWKGEVAVQGTAKTPLLFGDLRIVSGQYLFNGNPFALNQGWINFAGDLDKKTTLYVIAGKDLDKVKVDVIAKGPVRNPVISFRSNPPLPQREILSWILFNRGTSEISPFQGQQLSESITNLSTQQQGPDVLSKIRSTLKIDRFEISRNPQSDDNSVNVEVGKYISDNILISVIKSDVNRVAVEANITDNIKLRAQVGDDSEGQLLLKWKKDY